MRYYFLQIGTCQLKRIGVALVLTFLFSGMPLPAWSESNLVKEKIPASMNSVFEYFQSFIRNDNAQTVEGAALDGLLDFVMAPKDSDRLYYADGLFESTSAYYEFTIERDLSHVLKIAYNPELPTFLTNPSSVRLSFWTEFDNGMQGLPELWRYLEGDDKPLVFSGREIIENTPDTNTGAYYRYGLDRTLILMKHKGNNVLISLSKQAGTSDVGKKGVVLGSDEDWTYLYSDKKGLNKSGLGWIRSYMYDSFSIIVYYETPGESAQVKCGAFKWLNAGWKKINMVKEYHIHEGLQRFGRAYKSIVENESLPDVATMSRSFSKISDMEMEELQQLNLAYLKSIREQYKTDKSLSARWAADLVEDGQVEKMDARQLKAVLMLEHIKRILGKPYHIDVVGRS